MCSVKSDQSSGFNVDSSLYFFPIKNFTSPIKPKGGVSEVGCISVNLCVKQDYSSCLFCLEQKSFPRNEDSRSKQPGADVKSSSKLSDDEKVGLFL